jgi:uncharacterized membrane protein YjjP (DUF1212 family)
VDDGLTVAAGFFALGILWLFIGGWVVSMVEFVRRLLG